MGEADTGSVRNCWPDWPHGKTVATIRAHIAQQLFDAACTEGTFIATDTRLGRFWRQVLVAAFAIWTQLQHSLVCPVRSVFCVLVWR